ncbi:hypothetical protein N9A45_01900 [bacterium]|nr:hypothetical protein [bacterium]
MNTPHTRQTTPAKSARTRCDLCEGTLVLDDTGACTFCGFTARLKKRHITSEHQKERRHASKIRGKLILDMDRMIEKSMASPMPPAVEHVPEDDPFLPNSDLINSFLSGVDYKPSEYTDENVEDTDENVEDMHDPFKDEMDKLCADILFDTFGQDDPMSPQDPFFMRSNMEALPDFWGELDGFYFE